MTLEERARQIEQKWGGFYWTHGGSTEEMYADILAALRAAEAEGRSTISLVSGELRDEEASCDPG